MILEVLAGGAIAAVVVRLFGKKGGAGGDGGPFVRGPSAADQAAAKFKDTVTGSVATKDGKAIDLKELTHQTAKTLTIESIKAVQKAGSTVNTEYAKRLLNRKVMTSTASIGKGAGSLGGGLLGSLTLGNKLKIAGLAPTRKR